MATEGAAEVVVVAMATEGVGSGSGRGAVVMGAAMGGKGAAAALCATTAAAAAAGVPSLEEGVSVMGRLAMGCGRPLTRPPPPPPPPPSPPPSPQSFFLGEGFTPTEASTCISFVKAAIVGGDAMGGWGEVGGTALGCCCCSTCCSWGGCVRPSNPPV